MRTKTLSGASTPGWARFTAGLLFLLTLLLFSPVRHHDFINYDDPHYLTANPTVLGGLNWDGFKAAFTEPHFFMWHPLTTLSHQLDVTLFGLESGAHHVVNALIHALNAALLLLLLRTMTGAFWRALIVAALFAWHPLRVESVAWAAERKDTLGTLFWLLTLLAYARYAAKPGGKNYALVIVTFAFGIMTKPSIVTLPCVLLLLDVWPLKRWPAAALAGVEKWRQHWPLFQKLLLEKLPLFALSALLAVVTWQAQSRGDVIQSTESLTMTERLGNAVVSYARYLGKIIWPQDLVVFYPHPGQWPWPMVLGASLLVLGASAWVFRRRLTHPWELVGWLWFVGVLFPTIGIVQAGGQAMADRYSYVAGIGVLLAVVWSGEQVWRRVASGVPPDVEGGHPAARISPANSPPVQSSTTSRPFRRAGRRGSTAGETPAATTASILAIALALAACAWMTRVQLSHWQNSETLFRHVLAASPGNVVGYENLGSALISRGKLDEAVAVIGEGLKTHPGRPLLHNNLGLAYRALGQPEAAIEQYRLALISDPAYGAARNNLGNILRETGDVAGAVRELEAALKLDPTDAETMNNLALACEDAGRPRDALRLYQAAIAANPRNVEAHVNLGGLLLELGRNEEAVALCRRATSLNPDFIAAQMVLFYALAESGQWSEAEAAAARAMRLAHEQNRPDLRRTLEDDLARYGLRR